MKTGLLTIGNELLSGATINTNAAWLGRECLAIGFPISRVCTVPDEPDEVLKALDHLQKFCDILIVSGGLGPTHDDVTVQIMAEYFQSELELHEPTFQRVQEMLANRNIRVIDEHREQAMLPSDARILENAAGTAPGLYIKRQNMHTFCLPGVPAEMKCVFTAQVKPILRKLPSNPAETAIIRTAGVPESSLYSRLRQIVDSLPQGMVSFLPQSFGVDIRLIRLPDWEWEGTFSELIMRIKSIAGSSVYTDTEQSLAEIVGNQLRQNQWTLGIAESCTGGLLADEITNIPGSSDYFLEGVITYSNEAKISRLGVDQKLLDAQGAVSPEVAGAMAEGIVKVSAANVGLSTTGIAGPGGGSPGKPVGLIYIGCAIGDQVWVKRYIFSHHRRQNKERAVMAALHLLHLALTEATE